MLPENVLDFGSLKRHFQHFEGTFEQNIKVSNHIFNRVPHHIFKKYFGPNDTYIFSQSPRDRKIKFGGRYFGIYSICIGFEPDINVTFALPSESL